jgi:hypothetical protein
MNAHLEYVTRRLEDSETNLETANKVVSNLQQFWNDTEVILDDAIAGGFKDQANRSRDRLRDLRAELNWAQKVRKLHASEVVWWRSRVRRAQS